MRPADLSRACALTLVLALAAGLSGCWRVSWPSVQPGGSLRDGVAVLVGSVRVVPPIQQRRDQVSNTVFLGPSGDHLLAVFTRDLSEELRPGPGEPFARYEGAWVPEDGRFFLEVPVAATWYLRGFAVVTDRGLDMVEATTRLDFQADDRVVYVGELSIVRTRPRRLVVRNEEPAARADAERLGLGSLRTERWRYAPPDWAE